MTRRFGILGAATTMMTLALAACHDPAGIDETPSITELPRQLSASETEVIRASNRFAFDLAGRISHPDSSFFVSPLSASMTLGMILNGADGETHAQMTDVLGFSGLPEEEVNGSYESLIELLTGLDPTVEMTIGNAVWLRDGFGVLPSFRDRVREFFGARVESLDFSAPSATETINGWASDATNGRIEEIVEPPIPPNIVAFLMNAIYFKGTWTTQFDPDDTAPAPFHLPDGTTTEVPMMEARDVQARMNGTR
ncbi:MAG: serpin family protein, partial [Longimicrobiales bacterium]|nr:serpin family protein [Longimicrobiales bacterium]